MSYETFANYLFRLIHIWAVHIYTQEYYELLRLIYDRITKFVKNTSQGEICYTPRLKCIIRQIRTPEEYDKDTWEECDDSKGFELYEYKTKEEEPNNNIQSNQVEKTMKRPFYDYSIIKNIICYEEQVEYENGIYDLKPFETIRPVLLSDEEIVIYGYETQKVLTYFKNNMGILNDFYSKNKKKSAIKLNDVEEENYNCDEAFIYNFTGEKYPCILMIDNDIVLKFIESFTKNEQFHMCWDIFSVAEFEINDDFADENLNIYNNIQLNEKFDKELNFQEIECIF